jgi:hypothetical protein
VCPGLKSAGIKAPVGRPDDTPKQVGFGILIHLRKAAIPSGERIPSGDAVTFSGSLLMAESVGRFLESVSLR